VQVICAVKNHLQLAERILKNPKQTALKKSGFKNPEAKSVSLFELFHLFHDLART